MNNPNSLSKPRRERCHFTQPGLPMHTNFAGKPQVPGPWGDSRRQDLTAWGSAGVALLLTQLPRAQEDPPAASHTSIPAPPPAPPPSPPSGTRADSLLSPTSWWESSGSSGGCGSTTVGSAGGSGLSSGGASPADNSSPRGGSSLARGPSGCLKPSQLLSPRNIPPAGSGVPSPKSSAAAKRWVT